MTRPRGARRLVADGLGTERHRPDHGRDQHPVPGQGRHGGTDRDHGPGRTRRATRLRAGAADRDVLRHDAPVQCTRRTAMPDTLGRSGAGYRLARRSGSSWPQRNVATACPPRSAPARMAVPARRTRPRSPARSRRCCRPTAGGRCRASGSSSNRGPTCASRRASWWPGHDRPASPAHGRCLRRAAPRGRAIRAAQRLGRRIGAAAGGRRLPGRGHDEHGGQRRRRPDRRAGTGRAYTMALAAAIVARGCRCR